MSFSHYLLIFFVSFTATANAERIVSASGAVTEVIYALGAEAQLVGVDTTSTYPPAAQNLPNVGYQRALSLEGMISLRPDKILITAEAGPPLVLERLKKLHFQVIRLPTNDSPAGVLAMIAAIAKAVDREAAGQALIEKLQNQIDNFEKQKATVAIRPKVLFMLSTQQKMSAGVDTKAQAMLDFMGFDNVLPFAGYKPLSPEALVAAQPEVILVMGNPENMALIQKDLLQDPAIAQTPAGQKQRIVVVDGLLFLGFGPRFVEAAHCYQRLILQKF